MLRTIEWILLGAATSAAIIAGVRQHRPAKVAPWFLLAGSIVFLALGDACFALGELSLSQACYLVMFVLVSITLLQFIAGGSLLVDRARLIDLLAFACGTLLVVWVFTIGSSGRIGRISAAAIIGDLFLVGVALQLTVASRRNVSATLLLTGTVGSLAGDIAYPLAPSPLTQFCYVVLYVSWGLAAVHPSMTRLTQPMPPRPAPWRGWCAALLGASVATPPIVLLIEAVSGPVRDGVVIAVASGVTLVLTITRLIDAVTLKSRALARERGLRAATADLVAAADLPSVDAAVRAAVVQLMPESAARQVIFATDDRQLVLEGLPPARSGPEARSWWLAETDGEPATLVCALWLEPLAVARPSGGALVLTGRRDVLSATRDALEVLAGQAALALDRITLVEAVGRRDSDLYLRAVIRNTADLMLVIDEDQRIRYASPAVRELLGEELSPLATLADIVHPDDRGALHRALLAAGDGTLFCALQRRDHSQVLVEATYRDLRADRLVQGFVVTVRTVNEGPDPVEQLPNLDHLDELPAWVNRRSAQHRFRY